MTFIKYAYIVFIGVLFATFVGVGIAAFYKGPISPDYPASLSVPRSISTSSAQLQDQIVLQEKYNKESKSYQKAQETYDRNVSIISVIIAIIVLVSTLYLLKQIPVIADGLLLGAVLTLIYSIIRGFSSGDDAFRFFVVTIGLIVSLILGYIKFIQPNESNKVK
ncbi:MAG: hypothetical protein WCO06_06815 [Candidatus Roizmanbacteria bacterium]